MIFSDTKTCFALSKFQISDFRTCPALAGTCPALAISEPVPHWREPVPHWRVPVPHWREPAPLCGVQNDTNTCFSYFNFHTISSYLSKFHRKQPFTCSLSVKAKFYFWIFICLSYCYDVWQILCSIIFELMYFDEILRF